MKTRIFLLAASLMLSPTVNAADSQLVRAQTLGNAFADYGLTNTYVFSTNLITLTATNLLCPGPYHTFQVVAASTNAASLALDRTLDGSTWTIVGTNSFTSPGGNGEQTMTGKWIAYRLRVYGSNLTMTVTYLGGR